MVTTSTELIRPGALKIEKAREAIAKCCNVDEAKDIRDQALAVQVYARTKRAGQDTQNDVAEIIILAERRMGEILSRREKHKGGRPKKTSNGKGRVSTIDDLGITRNEASRAQQLAALPETVVQERLKEARTNLEKITTATVLGTKPPKPKSSIQNRRTPQWLFDYLDKRFGPFKLDAYADETNALCENYFDAETDACTQLWPDKTFCNPEFKHMTPPLEHAVKMATDRGIRSIFLAPVGCSQDWYHKLAIHGTIYVPDMRISFDTAEGKPTGVSKCHNGLSSEQCKKACGCVHGADRDTIVIALGREHQNPAWRFGAFRVAQLLIADHFKRLSREANAINL